MDVLERTINKSLNTALSSAINLKIRAKQAHWNMRGANFLMLHELMDTIAETADDMADILAERHVQLGGVALEVNQSITLSTESMVTHEIPMLVASVLSAMNTLKVSLNAARLEAEAANDPVTVDIVTSAEGDLDKNIWLLSAHGLVDA